MVGFVDGCVFTAVSGGTIDFTVDAAVPGYMTPNEAEAINGTIYRYRAQSDDLSEWEIGYGEYNTSGAIITRAVILKSSNFDEVVNFTVPPKVHFTVLAQDITANALGLKYANIPDIGLTGELIVDQFIKYLDCSTNAITSLNTTEAVSLEKLVCTQTDIVSLSVAQSPNLVDLNCSSNELLATISVGTLPLLTNLECQDCIIVALDASNCPSLISCICNDNAMDDLYVVGCVALTQLDCANNVLTYLDCTDTALVTLKCQTNAIVTLVVDDLPGLIELECFANAGLTALVLTNSLAINSINCSDCAITALDFSGAYTALQTLYAANNAFNSAMVDQILVDVDAIGNSNGTLDLQSNAVPGATGLTAKTSLEGRGWTVTVDT